MGIRYFFPVKHSKNRKTSSEVTFAIWRIFEELDKPKRTPSTMNLTSMQVIAQNAATHPGLLQPFSREHLKAH